MTENMLVRALAAHIRAVCANYRLQSADGTEGHAVSVWEGYLPEKHGSAGEGFPFVIVRPVSGRIEEEAANCAVDIIVGVRSEESEGYQYVLNMIRHIANSLFTLPLRTLDRRYVFTPDAEWDADPDAQGYPGWTGVLHTEWSFHSPQTVPHADVFDCGDTINR